MMSNNIIEELDLESLCENIPVDLLKAYRSSLGYPSTQNPNSEHAELRFSNEKRRFARYDYGKANYEVISANEAIEFVRQNKYNIQQLRIIYTPFNLVEYEVRPNGTIYAIYGDSEHSVTLNDKHYKNIRFAPWKAVIQNAQVIYKTDEYDHPLFDNDFARNRLEKEQGYKHFKPITANDSSYDPHKPHNNYTSNYDIVKGAEDVGFHTSFDKNIALAKKNKDNAFKEYTLARKALRELEKNKNLYEPEDYETFHAKALDKKTILYNAYLEICDTILKQNTKREKRLDIRYIQLTTRISNYTKQIQNLLDRGYRYKLEYERLLTSNNFNKERVNNIKKEIAQILINIETYRDTLTTISDEISRIEYENSINRFSNNMQVKLSTLKELQKNSITEHILRLNTLKNQMTDVNNELNALQPNTAARKAEKAAKNKIPELDPNLINIVNFIDFD